MAVFLLSLSLFYFFNSMDFPNIYFSVNKYCKSETVRLNENCYSFWFQVANNRADLELATGRVISSLESRGRHVLKGKGRGWGCLFLFSQDDIYLCFK